MEEPLKVGFIVEGEHDRIVVETIAGRVLPDGATLRTVRIGGKAALGSIYSTVWAFREAAYDAVLVVFDTDADDLESQTTRVRRDLERHGIREGVAICPASPELEAWLLAMTTDDPESLARPRRRLAETLGRTPDAKDYERMARELDLEIVARRSPSFRAFLESLGSIGREPSALTSSMPAQGPFDRP